MSDTNLHLNNKIAKEEGFKQNIVTDYPRVSLNKNEITFPDDKRGGFVIPYPNTSSENNLFYTLDGEQYNYTHKKIYIHQLIHYNIQGITTDDKNIIGELIIEHHTLSRPEKIFTCYFLKTKPMLLKDENEIDKILSMPEKEADNLDVDLNAVLPKQENCIIYEDKGNKVFVFTTPILINTASKEKIVNNFSFTTDLFAISPKQEGFSIRNKSLLIEGMESDNATVVVSGNNISNRDAEEIYIDCNPTGVSEEEVNMYNVPINSKMASESQESDYMKTTVNFGLFMLTALISYIIVPLFYKNAVIDTSTILFNIDTVKRFDRIRSSDILIGIAVLIIIASLFGAGTSKTDMYSTTAAMFVYVFYILSVGLILLKKTQSTFMTTRYKNNDITSDYESEEGKNISAFNLDDIGDTLMLALKFMFLRSENLSAFTAGMFVVTVISLTLSLVGVISRSQFGTILGSSALPMLAIVNTIMLIKIKHDASKK
tara:strand:+ start:4474 stop:5931 length:1458 start_codon:yes stop_codon:yes gene_type:complete